MVSDDAINRGQPEAGSSAHPLGGEKWIEDALRGLFVHTRSRVGYLYNHVVPWSYLRRFAGYILVSNIHGLYGQVAPRRHGICGIDIKVPQDLLDLPLIRLYCGQIFGQVVMNPNFLFRQAKGTRCFSDKPSGTQNPPDLNSPIQANPDKTQTAPSGNLPLRPRTIVSAAFFS